MVILNKSLEPYKPPQAIIPKLHEVVKYLQINLVFINEGRYTIEFS